MIRARLSFPLPLLGLAIALLAMACSDKVTGPQPVVPRGQIGVFADLGPSGVTTLVIQVSGPGIVKPDGSADTLGFNIPLSNGVASGSVDIPAGPSRVITARAFVGVTETHRGTVTANILEGNNPTVQITLVPLVGNVPLTVSIGSTIVVVRPLLASVGVGDTLRLTAEIRDHNGQLVTDRVRWATLNPLKASVDTLGLVTVRDTGDVQVVATYGTVGGASKVTGVLSASVSAIHLTWNGSVSTAWYDPNNWTPHGIGAARYPRLADSVVIPAGVPRMPNLNTCGDSNMVGDIVVETGATLTTSCYPLNVYRSAVVRGSIPASVNVRPNAKLAGTFSNITILGDGARLIDSVVAGSVNVNIPVGTFLFDHHTLRTIGDFNVSDGTVTMVDGDTLIVGANTSWSGDDESGLLTGGVVLSRGNQFAGYRYYGTGTSRLVFDRAATGQQTMYGFDYVNNPANSLIRRLEIRNRDGVNLCSHIRVTDTLSFVSTGTPASMTSCGYNLRVDGPVVTTANTDVTSNLVELRHPTGTSLVLGTWHPQYTDFYVDDAIIKPTLAYGNLRFFAKNTIPANMSVSGHLLLNGPSTELDINGKRLNVAGYLQADNGATLKMLTAADSVIVGEYGYFQHDFHLAQKPRLAAGVISFGAYLYGYGFASAGTKVVMSGTSASSSKYISGMNYEARGAQQLYDLEIAPNATYGLCERVKVAHDVTVRAGAKLQEWCGGSYLAVQNDLVTEATSTVNPYLIALNSPLGTSHVDGAFSPDYADFNVTDAAVKPGLGYQIIRFFAANHLLGPTTATNFVYLSGAGVDLNVNGQTLTIGQHLQLDNNSTLTMTNPAGAVSVGRYAYFNANTSTAENGKLTAGTLTVGEYLYGFGFSASGTHKVVMTGTYASTQKYISGLSFESRPIQGFQDLEIAAGATYGLCDRVEVKGTLTVNTGATINEWCGGSYLRLDNDVVAAAGSTISNYNVQLFTPVGTQHVSGTFSPTYTSLHTTAATGQLKPGLGYRNMQFYAPATLTQDLDIDGEMNVDGAAAILNLGGHQVTVSGNLNVRSNATIVMHDESDLLDVTGNVSWSGGGSEAGKIDQGTTIFRGSTFCAQNFETSGYHNTIFDRASGGPVRYQCVSSSSTSQLLRNIQVQGQGLAIECHMNVSQTVHVVSGSTITQNCGSGMLYVGNDLQVDEGAAVTNGAGYPASNQMSVVFGGSIATAHVNGGFDPHVTYFTALNSSIKPTWSSGWIHYRHARIDQSTAFQDTTGFDGGLTIINNAIVDLAGHKVAVAGGMNFDNNAKLKMVNPADTLIVGWADPSSDFFWDGGDNINDGTSPLLTNGVVIFHGDRFGGQWYRPAPGTPHKFVFASNGGGTVSVEGRPSFAQVDITGLRTVYLNDYAVVQDTLFMAPSTALTAASYVQVLGDLRTEPGSDISMPSVYLDGRTGTRNVNGAFHPVTTYFRSATPFADAIKPGLAYQSVQIQGPYMLSGGLAQPEAEPVLGGPSAGQALFGPVPDFVFGGNLGISQAGARLTLNGQKLRVNGSLDIHTGGALTMNNETDSLGVANFVRFQPSADPSTILSAGILSIAGPYWDMQRDGIEASGSHTLIMNGTGAQTVYAYQNGGSRGLNNVMVSGSGSVDFYYGLKAIGFLEVGSREVSAPVTVTAGQGGGALHVTGDISVGIGATMTVPDGSTFSGFTQTRGLLRFSGASVSTNDLYVTGAGIARALSTSGTKFVDFRCNVSEGGTIDNGTGGGFRFTCPSAEALKPDDQRSSLRSR